MSRSPANRFAALDALRGIAALLVVWQHTSEYLISQPGMPPDGSGMLEFFKAIDPGRIGVICFFLISGFIIPSSLRSNGSAPLTEFSIKRFFRLFPAYWLSVGLAVLVDTVLLDKHYDANQIGANLTMIQNLLGFGHVQGLYWTLQVELIFYMLCAALFSINLLNQQKSIFYTLIISLGIFSIANLLAAKLHLATNANKEVLYTPYLLGVMLCGTLFRNWLDSKNEKNKLLMIGGFFLVFSVPFANMALNWAGINLIADPTRFLISHLIGLGLFIFGMYFWHFPPPFFLRLGVISYSVYLFHPVVMHFMGGLNQKGWVFNLLPQNIWLQVATATLLVWLTAEATYRLIEEPFNNMAKRLCQSIRTRSVTPSQ